MTGNAKRKFDANEASALGKYVYALRDPRDWKIFYVGVGSGDRVFEHFFEAEKLENQFPKHSRIREIWSADCDVDWFIVRRNLASITMLDTSNLQEVAEDIEAALIDILAISQNRVTLNEQGGKRNSIRGLVGLDELQTLAAQPVAPEHPHDLVILFPIRKAIASGRSAYEATRAYWSLAEQYRQPGAIAIGLLGGVGVGVFVVKSWTKNKVGRWEFEGTSVNAAHELYNKNWSEVISKAMGYYQRGNPLAVSLDGKGNVKILRGSSNKSMRKI